jgi:NAD(P)-dependent dehydrogenase (short-subunit alcohol dehydrogenase family)
MPPFSGPTKKKFEDIPDDEFEETYRVNVSAMFRLCKAILPQMKVIVGGNLQRSPDQLLNPSKPRCQQ